MSKSLCVNGKEQSPINILSKDAKKCGATCDLTFFYRTSKLNLILSDRNLILDYDTGSYVNFNQDVYELDKISFTNPSGHKIDNNSHPLEVNLYHRSPNTGNIIILAVFLEVNDAISRSKIFFDSIIPSIPKKRGEQISSNMNETWNVFNALPEAKAFFLYNGSIPRYPCTEGVTWIVFDEPVNCSEEFYNSIIKCSKNNARSLKRIGYRSIYYNPNSSDKNLKNYSTQMRCYTDQELRRECQKLSGNTKIIRKNNEKILVLMLVVVVIIFIVLLVLYLIDVGFMAKYLESFNNLINKKIINQ